MKQVIAFLLVLVMCLAMCACGKSDKVKKVEQLISAIDVDSVSCDEEIKNAEIEYKNLTNDEQKQVENYDILLHSKEQYKAKKVEKLISALDPTSLSCDEAIENAEREYSYLTDDEKKQVENYDVLLRTKDQYEDNIKAMYIGTWKSDKWVDENGEEWDATYVIDEGGAGSFSDFNYAKNKTSNSGNLTWETEGVMLKTEMHHIIFGVVPRAFKLCEIDGEICLERVGEQNTQISQIFRKQ